MLAELDALVAELAAEDAEEAADVAELAALVACVVTSSIVAWSDVELALPVPR